MATGAEQKQHNTDTMEALSEHYEVERKIGYGSFGQVYLGTCKLTKQPVCIKKINKRNPRFSERDLEREIEAGRRLSHPGLAKLRFHQSTADNEWLVFDYVDGLDLLELMQRREMEPMMEEEARSVFRQIVEALVYCHKEGISHRDIKLENIMIERTTFRTKIIDFGLCEVRDPKCCVECVGSINYCAPEIAARKGPYDSFLSDVFSLGVVLYALLFARFPYAPVSKNSLQLELLDRINWKPGHPSYPVSECAIDLIKQMLMVNPARRISLQGVMDHPWMKKGTKTTFDPNMSS